MLKIKLNRVLYPYKYGEIIEVSEKEYNSPLFSFLKQNSEIVSEPKKDTTSKPKKKKIKASNKAILDSNKD